MNIDVLYDDRDCSIGKKLSDNELNRYSLIKLIIGKRDLKNNLIEIKNRLDNNDSQKMSPDEVINFLKNKLINNLMIIFSSYEKLLIKRFLFSKKTDGFISIFSWFSIIGITIGVRL